MKHASTNYIIICLFFAYSCNSAKIGMNSNNKSDLEKEWLVWRDSLKKQQPLLKKVIQDKVPINAMNDVYKQLYQIKDKNVRPYYIETKKELNKLTLYPMPVYEIDATKSPKWNDEQPLEPLLKLDKNKCYVYLGKGKTFYYGILLGKKDGVWKMNAIHIKAENYADSVSNLYFNKKEIPFWFIYTYKNRSNYSLAAFKNNGIWMYFGPGGKGLKLSTEVN